MEHDVAVHIREHCVPYSKEKNKKTEKNERFLFFVRLYNREIYTNVSYEQNSFIVLLNDVKNNIFFCIMSQFSNV